MTDEDKTQAREAVSSLLSLVNGYNGKAVAAVILERLQNEHRTLQQGFLDAVKFTVEGYGALDERIWTDLRNQQAHAWARRVLQLDRADGVDGVRFSHI